MVDKHESGTSNGENPNADAWGSLSSEATKGATYVKGPDGKMIPKEEYDAAMEAYEREEYYKSHPGAKEAAELDARLGEMDADPDRLDNFEGEHKRGASDRNGEYMTLNSGENGMYAAAPDGTPLNNAKRQEMTRMMHDAEDLQSLAEDDRYADYIAREREKIGTIYKSQSDFNHRVVERLKNLQQKQTAPSSENPSSEESEKDEKTETGKNELKKIEQEFVDIKEEDIKRTEESLEKLRPALAELYAKNRRIIVGAENRASFTKAKEEYSEILDRYIKLKCEKAYDEGKHELASKLDKRVDELYKEIEEELTKFAGGDLEKPEKTQKEINEEKARLVKEAQEVLQKEYADESNKLKAEINAKFLEELIEQEIKLEEATTNALDNGSFCRKFVDKVLHNKVLKGALVAASVTGLAITGIGLAGGLAAGTIAVGSSYTAGGIALGATKGALGGLIMSRQNSSSSAVHGFADKDKIREQIKNIDFTDENNNDDVSNISSWLLDQYAEANQVDAGSNRKRTLIATGLGAAAGAIMSGIRVENKAFRTEKHTIPTGERNPVEYHISNMDKVDIPQGKGVFEYFNQLGGNPENNQRALEIAQSLDSKYHILSDINGIHSSAGNLVNIYPGKISSWPDVAQSWATEMAEEWAKNGLIDFKTSGGEPLYNTITNLVDASYPNALANFFSNKVAPIASGIVAGAAIGNRPNSVETRNSNRSQASSESVPVIEGETGRTGEDFNEKIIEILRRYYDSLSQEEFDKLVQDLRLNSRES